MGNDDSLHKGSVENHTTEGSHGNVVQTGSVEQIHIAAPPPRWGTLPTVVSSVLLLAVGALTAIVFSAPNGGGPEHDAAAKSRQETAPSPSATGPSKAPSIPPSPRPSKKPKADGKDLDADLDAGARPSGSADVTGPRRPLPVQRTTVLGKEIRGDQAVSCGEHSLCGYRKPNHQERYDFAAPTTKDWDVCFNLPAGAPGFVALVNGVRYSLYVYDERGCKGDVRPVTSDLGYQGDDWNGFAFLSYAKA